MEQPQRERAAESSLDYKGILLPIAKRIPRYLRLALALIREPAIPHQHKSMLYATVVYQVTPIHLLVTPIPVVGQVDTAVLLLLGIRQALHHCPDDVALRHFTRLRLLPTQLGRDLDDLGAVSASALHTAQVKVGRDLRFAGRVVSSFGRRQIGRMLAGETRKRHNAETESVGEPPDDESA